MEFQVDVPSVELASPSSLESEATRRGGEGVDSRANPPMDAYRRAI